MSGRGRGGGRKYTPPSGARLQLQKTAEEIGFDSRNLRSLQSRPDLFPDIYFHSSGKKVGKVKVEDDDTSKKSQKVGSVVLNESTQKLIQKGREIQHEMQNSGTYLRFSKEIPDVVRFSDLTKKQQADGDLNVIDIVMRACTSKTVMGQFLPAELVMTRKRSTLRKKTSNSMLDLEGSGTAGIESNPDKIEDTGGVEKGVDDDDDEFEEDVEADCDDGGYGVNHYESEGDEESMGDDDEPVF